MNVPQEEQNKALVIEAMTSAFIRRDPDAFERYWDEGYIQHSPTIPAWRDGLKSMWQLFHLTLRIAMAWSLQKATWW